MTRQLNFTDEYNAKARRTDPLTSHQAAASVSDITEKQRAVLAVISALQPVSDDVIVSHYMAGDRPKQSPSGIRTRRSELVAAGYVEACGWTVLLSGRKAQLWKHTGKAWS